MSMLFKKILLLGIIFMSAGDLYGGNLISRQIEQNGSFYDAETYFTSLSDLTIRLTDNNIYGDWNVAILNEKDEYVDIPFIITDYRQCVITPFDETIKKISRREAKKIYNESLNRDFFQLKVTYTASDKNKDEIYLKWGLVPSRPIISNVIFIANYCDWDWEYDMIYPYGDFSFDIYSENANYFNMYVSEGCLFELPDFFEHLVGHLYNVPESTKMGYDADWGEFVFVSAINSFGAVHSDTICTTSYITDEMILKRIEELKNEAGIGDVSVDIAPPTYQWNNSTLTFNTQIDQIHIYDLSGQLCHKTDNCDTVDLSDLHNGFYIIVYQYKSQIYKTKIFKS